MFCAVYLPLNRFQAHFFIPAVSFLVNLFAVFPNLLFSAPEVCGRVFRLAFLDILLGHNYKFILYRVGIFDIAEASDDFAAVKGIIDCKFIIFYPIFRTLFNRPESVRRIDKLDRDRKRRLYRILFRNVLNAVISGHQSHIIFTGFIILIRYWKQVVFLHHIKSHAGIMHNIQGKVVQVDIPPCDREIVVVFFVILVFFVLSQAFFLCGFQRPVNGDEIALNQLPLIVRYLNLSDRAAEFLHHLCGEAFSGVRLYFCRNLCGCGLWYGATGSGRGFRCSGCHFTFLPDFDLLIL